MTEIQYTQRNEIVRISVVGHALYNPGNDPVCAGISSITFQMLACIGELEDDQLIYDVSYDINDGFVVVQFDLAPEVEERWKIMWSVIHHGYKNIADEYPENVTID